MGQGHRTTCDHSVAELTIPTCLDADSIQGRPLCVDSSGAVVVKVEVKKFDANRGNWINALQLAIESEGPEDFLLSKNR